MEETSEKNHGSGGSGEFLEQAITCAAHNRFGKADPGYIARDGGWGMGAPGHTPRWHTPAWWWEPAQLEVEADGMCVNKDRRKG